MWKHRSSTPSGPLPKKEKEEKEKEEKESIPNMCESISHSVIDPFEAAAQKLYLFISSWKT